MLPNVRVTGIVYHLLDKHLYVSTYGRGVWSIPIDDVFKGLLPKPAA